MLDINVYASYVITHIKHNIPQNIDLSRYRECTEVINLIKKQINKNQVIVIQTIITTKRIAVNIIIHIFINVVIRESCYCNISNLYTSYNNMQQHLIVIKIS